MLGDGPRYYAVGRELPRSLVERYAIGHDIDVLDFWLDGRSVCGRCQDERVRQMTTHI